MIKQPPKKWIIADSKSHDLIKQILLNREIPKNKWTEFLNPDFSRNLHDPFDLDGMTKTVDRIQEAIIKKEVVGIFADYDADGIPASVMLAEALERYGLKTKVYIPARNEGYGLNIKGLDELKAAGASLLITVDLGTREVDNTDYAKSLGMDVIITDHHEPGKNIPNAYTIINPKLKDSHYPFRELSGGGVVFKLIQALSQKLKVITTADLKWFLDLVGITTICDVVPLVDENRIFAKYGLIVLSKTKRIGLKQLYKAASIIPEEITTYTVGFQIGPRLNAPGRLGEENEGFDLLKSKNEEEATSLAISLDNINKRRQLELDKVLEEAKTRVIKEKLNEKKVIMLWDKKWSNGLIGLVAGKLVEIYSRPCIVLEQGEDVSRGSARSIDKYNIVEALEESKSLLKNFGGHSKAAGLTIKNEQLPFLYEKLLKIADDKLTPDDLVSKIMIDAVVSPEEMSFKSMEKIKSLEPFGLGNPRPVFAFLAVRANNLKIIGADHRHLKFNIGNLSAIGFGLANQKDLIENRKIDVAFTLDENIWNGQKNLQLKIIDIR